MNAENKGLQTIAASDKPSNVGPWSHTVVRYGAAAHLIKVKVLISSRAPQINKWAYPVARRSELVLVRSVCSSLFTMDGGRLKGCTEGGKFRLVISTQ